MLIEGLSATTTLSYCIGVSLLLSLLAILQRARIISLEDEADRLTLRYQKRIAARVPTYADMILRSPYPSCVTNYKGEIVTANPSFERLTGSVRVRSIAQFDSITLASLGKSATAKGRHNQPVTLRHQSTDSLRQFVATSWPLGSGDQQAGRVIILHEQTNVIRRKASQAQFESELISLIASLSAELQTALKQNKKAEAALLSQELESISGYLSTSHPSLRDAGTASAVDIVSTVKDSVRQVTPLAKERGVLFTLTLPRKGHVLVGGTEFNFAIESLLSSLITHGKHGDRIRIDVDQVERRMRLLITSQGFNIPSVEHDARLRTPHDRQFALRLAVARELLERQHAHLEIQHLAGEPTVITITAAIDAH
jgi:hypothetical protein